MIFRRQWRLRTSLIWLLGLTTTITFLLAGIILFVFRLPQIATETQAELRNESQDLVHRTEATLGGLQTQLELVAAMLVIAPDQDLQPIFDRAVMAGGFSALYQIDAHGKVKRAAVSRKLGKRRQLELIGNDLSGDRLYQQVSRAGQTLWSDKYLSPVSNSIAVGVGTHTRNAVLIGEIPLDFMFAMLQMAGNTANGRSLWVFDQRGEILADSENAMHAGVVSLVDQPIFARALSEKKLLSTLQFEGRTYDAAVDYSPVLNWYFLTRTPSGLTTPRVISAIEFFAASLGVSIVIGLLLAPLWATRMAQPISDIARRAWDVAHGELTQPWPRSLTVELNELSDSMASMSASILAREEELAAIFNASPIGLAVLDPKTDYCFLRGNQTLVELLGYSNDELIGRNGLHLGLWCDLSRRKTLYEILERDSVASVEGWLRCKDGHQLLAAISARTALIGGQQRTIWVITDITAMRRIEDEIRQLNSELEIRVQQRTEMLNLTNSELSRTVERLKFAQHELVRSEKLASLGSLVAGVAHELNTPIGNGVMAVSTLRNALRQFHERSADGLKRSQLDSLLEAVDTGSDIAERNLLRAAELVSSFKQVAADQTSSQRRDFLLDAMVGEIAITLRPLLGKSVARLEIDIPPDIGMESYPGPLGQILTNLINNACLHAFAGRDSGSITVRARPNGDRVLLQVIDDGNGIAPNLLPRIFDPFVTTRMGRGGTGLGLHIVHNMTIQVLGGSIAVRSEEGHGSCFELDLPCIAPQLRTTPE